MGNYDDSVRDIDRTLALEPRHWGALSGLGMIYQNTEREEEAIGAYRRALAANPHLLSAKSAIDFLTQKTKGREL
jgi:Flp pilus assembly protein TadD